MDAVEAGWETGKATFPAVDVSLDAFRAFLERHRDATPGAALLVPDLASDVYLVCGCETGDAAAISAFATQNRGVIESVRRRFGARAPAYDELWSELSERLFVRKDERAPKIGEYSGRGALGSWLRVVVLRHVLNRLEARAPDEPAEPKIVEELLAASPEGDPEGLLARSEMRAQLERAFREAAVTLPARARRVLRLSFVTRLSIDDIGALYGVHRATAARWLKDACEELSVGIRKNVRSEGRLSDRDYDRWADSLTRSMDVSIARYLESRTPDTTE